MTSITNDGVAPGIAFDFGATLSVITAGYGTITHVFYLDNRGLVDVRTDGKTIFVRNIDDQSSGPGQPIGHTGVVKMIW